MLAQQEQTVTITGRVVDEDSITYESSYGGGDTTIHLLYLEQTRLVQSNRQYSLRTIKCKCKSDPRGGGGSLLGCLVTVSGTLAQPAEATNPGEFDRRTYEQGQKIDFYLEDTVLLSGETAGRGIRPWLWSVRADAEEILDAVFPKEQAAVLKAMLLGDKQDVDAAIRSGYQAAGISHVLAISGLHMTLLGMGLWKVLSSLGISMHVSAVLSTLMLCLYGVLIGQPTTAMRALLMFVCMMGAKLLGRSYDLLSALALAVLLLLIDNPDLLWQGGFQLSCLAVAGMGIYVPVNKRLREMRRKTEEESSKKKRKSDGNGGGRKKAAAAKVEKLRQNLDTGIDLWFFMLPVVLYHYYQVSVAGIVWNLLVIPLLPVVLLSGASALFLGVRNIFAGSIAGLPACKILEVFEKLGIWSQNLRGMVWVAGQPAASQIVLYYIVMFLGVILPILPEKLAESRWEKQWLYRVQRFCLPILLLLIIAEPWHRSCSIAVLDVGQGDGIVLQSEGRTLMIDGGSSSRSKIGQNVLLPYLKQQGISHVDGILLTHPDEDHKNGLEEILAEAAYGWLTVEELYLPAWMERTDKGEKMESLAETAGCRVRYLSAGDRILLGEASLSVLYPEVDREGKGIYKAYEADPNSGSMVLSYCCRNVKGYFMGDLPAEQEGSLLPALEDVDFLKAGHHGSDYSSSEAFLAKVSPELVLISCGRNNRYGHPGQEMLERVEAVHAAIHRTDQEGALLLQIGD